MTHNIDRAENSEFKQCITNVSADIFSFGYNVVGLAFNCAKFSLKATTSLAYAIVSLDNDSDQTKNYEYAKDYAIQSATDLYTSGKYAMRALVDIGHIARDTVQLVSEISTIGYASLPKADQISSVLSDLYNQYVSYSDNTASIDNSIITDAWSLDLAADLPFYADQN